MLAGILLWAVELCSARRKQVHRNTSTLILMHSQQPSLDMSAPSPEWWGLKKTMRKTGKTAGKVDCFPAAFFRVEPRYCRVHNHA